MARIRGLETRHEQRPQELLRDTRPTYLRFYDAISKAENGALILVMMAVTGYLFPVSADIVLPLGVTVFLMCLFKRARLPFRMPETSKLPDYNDPLPGTEKPRQARGIAFFGNERESNQELWFNNDDMRTHVLIFGSTGAGKTEALVSIAFNSLVQGSGFIYIDGKGDNSLFAKVFSMARSMGREDDILLINFMTGARDIVGAQRYRMSNTMNPFSRGSSGMLSQLVTSLMDSGGQGGDGDMWKGRAIAFIEALMRILTYMRDRGDILLDANSIRKYFLLPRLEMIVLDKKFPLDDERAVSIEEAPDIVVEPLMNYLDTLPGYTKANKGKQAGEVLEQHGFITMQLTRAFSSLADTYGHIIRTKLAEVDLKDIVLNRRILVVLLPALEKSPEELANLGKIIVASLKAMMAAGLGDQVEGTYQEVIERKPTTSVTPFVCIMDEYGYYAVKGFAVVPAQARSLGFSAIFAGQDLPAFEKSSKEEAASIGANTNIKICMKLEDPTSTWEFFQKTASEAYVTTSSGFQANQSSLTNTYTDNRSAQVEKRARVDLLDLKDQREGEAHIFFKSKIVRATMFYSNPKPVPRLKVNQFLKCDEPEEEWVNNMLARFDKFDKAINDPQITFRDEPLDEDLHFVIEQMAQNKKLPAVEQSLVALHNFYHQASPYIETPEEEEVWEETPGKMDIFTLPQSELPDFENFDPLALLTMPALVGPLLDRKETRRNIEMIERMLGKTKGEAAIVSAKILGDLRTATVYPPEAVETQQVSQVVGAIHDLINFYSPGSAGSGTTEHEPEPEFPTFDGGHDFFENKSHLDLEHAEESAKDPFAEFEDLFKDTGAEQHEAEPHEELQHEAEHLEEEHHEESHAEAAIDPFAEFEDLFGKHDAETDTAEHNEEAHASAIDAVAHPDLEHFLNIDHEDVMKDIMEHHDELDDEHADEQKAKAEEDKDEDEEPKE